MRENEAISIHAIVVRGILDGLEILLDTSIALSEILHQQKTSYSLV